MFSSWILVFPAVVVVLVSPSASQSPSSTPGSAILYSTEIAFNIDLEPDIKTVAVLNGTLLVRALNSSSQSKGDRNTGFHAAFQDVDLIIYDGHSNNIHASKCASYKTLTEKLKVPFVAHYENGLLKHVEITRDEPVLSANLKLISSYIFNVNTDLTFVQTKQSPEVSGTSDEFCEYGGAKASYKVKKTVVGSGYDILVQKQMDTSSSTKSLSWIRRPSCSTENNIKFAWNYKSTMAIQERNGVTTAPKTTIEEQVSYIPHQDSASKINFKKSTVVTIKSGISSSLTADFSKGSRKVSMIESVKEAVSDGDSNPTIKKVTEALSCGPPAMYAYFGIYNLALRCDKA